MKYTLEIMKEYEDAFRGISVYSVSEDKKLMVDFVALEELEDAQKEMDEAYQRGLDDAWEAARKVGHASQMQLKEMGFEFNSNEWSYNPSWYVVMNYTAAEAIEKIKAYEDKQKADNCIEIGDEVEWDGDKYIVTYRNIDINTGVIQDYDLMMWDGSVVDHVKKCSFVKTGRHFDIPKILEEMKE